MAGTSPRIELSRALTGESVTPGKPEDVVIPFSHHVFTHGGLCVDTDRCGVALTISFLRGSDFAFKRRQRKQGGFRVRTIQRVPARQQHLPRSRRSAKLVGSCGSGLGFDEPGFLACTAGCGACGDPYLYSRSHADTEYRWRNV